jgi:hypothetical protein
MTAIEIGITDKTAVQPAQVIFYENTREQGAPGFIYISKKMLEQMGRAGCQELVVRLEAFETAAGGETIVQEGRRINP